MDTPAQDGGRDAAPELTHRFPCLLGGPRRLPVDAELFEEGDAAWRLQWDAASRVAPADAAASQGELAGVLEAEAHARWRPREATLLVAVRVVCAGWLRAPPQARRSAAPGRPGRAP